MTTPQRSSHRHLIAAVALLVLLGTGVVMATSSSVFFTKGSGGSNGAATVVSVTTIGSTTFQFEAAATGKVLSGANNYGLVGNIYPYDCPLPAALTDLTCATLPEGFVIPPHDPNSPQATRPAGMTDAAWALFQKTFGDGYCTPNETFLTDPLDCAAYGDQINDPYTGRVSSVSSICFASSGAINPSQTMPG